MSKLKKLFIVLVACAIACTALLISSCGGNDDKTNTQTNTQTSTQTSTSTGTNTQTNTQTSTNTSTNTENGPVNYYVYVTDQNGMPIEGVDVQICKDGLCLTRQITDANGRAKFQYFEKAQFNIQINTVPDDCVHPGSEYIPFPEGSTTAMVEIVKMQTYTVTASDLYGNKLSSILVELYNKETNELVSSFVTEENGRAVFEVEPAEYYAVVKHADGNGAFFLTGSEGDNKITFEKSKNVQAQFAILDDAIDYTVTLVGADQIKVKGAEIKLYNENFELVDTKTADETGVVTFSAPNGSYYATIALEGHYAKAIMFKKNGDTSLETTVENVTPGADKDHPIMILGDIDVTINAGEQLWYFIPEAQGKKVEINSETAKVRQSATNYTPKNGVIEFDLMVSTDGGAVVRISTELTEGSDNITGRIYEPGSEKTPYELDVNEMLANGMVVEVAENGRVYYTFVATKDGTITATTETENAVIAINGNIGKKSVKEGDTVVICFYTEKQVGDNIEHPSATIGATFTYELVQANYKVITVRDSVVSGGVTIELYEKNGDEYKRIESVASGTNGEVIFANMNQAANYYIKVICEENYETVNEYEPFGDETELTVYVNHVRDGSAEYPFLIASGESDTTTANVTLDGTIKWYTSFYIQGAQISIDNGDATVKIYTVTSAEGEPTLIATLKDDALLHTLSDDLGTTTRVLISVEGTTGNVNLSFVAPEIEE